MSRWRNFQKHRYLIAATGTILAATFALVLTQYRSVRQAEWCHSAMGTAISIGL